MAINVKLIRFVNGEEIIAEVLSDTTNLVIKNPVRVVVMPTKSDPKMPTVGFAPWADFSDDKEFTLDKHHVLVIMNPITEFRNQYNGMFGGIVAPSSKLIMPGM
jgi:hypothetical protein